MERRHRDVGGYMSLQRFPGGGGRGEEGELLDKVG
jgi:hypothetical protein